MTIRYDVNGSARVLTERSLRASWKCSGISKSRHKGAFSQDASVFENSWPGDVLKFVKIRKFYEFLKFVKSALSV